MDFLITAAKASLESNDDDKILLTRSGGQQSFSNVSEKFKSGLPSRNRRESVNKLHIRAMFVVIHKTRGTNTNEIRNKRVALFREFFQFTKSF